MVAEQIRKVNFTKEILYIKKKQVKITIDNSEFHIHLRSVKTFI